MAHILSTTLPIFALIAVGFLAVRFAGFPKDLLGGIGRFVLYFAMPALIFRTISATRIGEIADPLFLSAYGIGSLASFVLLFSFSRLVLGNGTSEAGLKGFGAALPNSIYVGYPMLLQVFEDPPVVAFAMALLVENLLIFPLALIVMDMGAGAVARGGLAGTLKGIGGQMARNPLLLAIVAGAAMSAIGADLPGPVDKVIALLAQAAPAAALFFIGGMLVGTSVRGSTRSIAAVATGKLVIHPLLVAGCIALLPDFDHQLQTAAVLIAASPMLAIYPIIGARYGHGPVAASILLATTSASFVTISVALGILLP